MASTNRARNIVIVGASGTIGTPTLKALLDSGNFNITVISRSDSSATFPESPLIKVKKGSYDDPEFLASALTGQDVLVIMLSIAAGYDPQTALIDAAAKAGVKYILPVEYGSDTGHPKVAELPLFQPKVAIRQHIEELAKTHSGLSWIGIVTNPWLGYCLRHEVIFQISPSSKTATLLDGGNIPFNTTTVSTAGLAIARLLSLPLSRDADSDKPSLQDYANKFVFVSSFRLTQRELLASVQRVTDTKPEEWTVKEGSTKEVLDEGYAKLQKGDFSKATNLIGGVLMQEGGGGDYESSRGTANEVLGLPKEDLDDVVRKALADPPQF